MRRVPFLLPVAVVTVGPTSTISEQQRSNGLIPSGFDMWLAQQRARSKYAQYDPDKELHERV